MTIYKIVNKDGLYSTGGTSPSWTKEGKEWRTIGSVKNSLNLYRKYAKPKHYAGCSIVEIELEVVQYTVRPLEDLFANDKPN